MKFIKMTTSEKFVADLCAMSFLPFWSFPGPIGKKGKELCDLLVVCHNTIIIFSVKDITPSQHDDEVVVYDRWVKKAIIESISQIYGAERFINTVDSIQLKNSDHIITLPVKEKRIIHRVAIAFGSKDYYPLPMGDFENGYVNVFDEKATTTILKELDTVTDFTNYLLAKQRFSEKHTIMLPYETDFLAFYLQTGLSLDVDEDVVLVGENLWEDYSKSEKYAQWKTVIEVSYVWDMMIQRFYMDYVKPGVSHEKRRDMERAIRLINLEPRINRLELGLILENASKTKVKARMIKPFDGAEHTYVFMPLTADNWEHKEAELGLRCIVARAQFPEAKKIIGIAIGRTSEDNFTFDLHYLNMPEIDEKFIANADSIKEELGFFKKITQTHSKDMR